MLLDELAGYLADPRVCERYRSRVRSVEGSDCLWWVGAISGAGHGRFWLGTNPTTGRDRAIVAHRFGWALEHGPESIADPGLVLAHNCDNPLCQNNGHLTLTQPHHNSHAWATRRHTPGNPLRDTRGSLQRARALRTAILTGQPLTTAITQGNPDADQAPLF